MNKEQLIKVTEDFAKASSEGYDSGHDWYHTDRVRRLALKINYIEKLCDPFCLELAALLHDTADSKFAGDKYYEKTERVSRFLAGNGLEEFEEKILIVIKNISFSSRDKSPDYKIPELQIIQDADRLDAIGAIGVARAFNYGGFRNNVIWDPEGGTASTIVHFYDKLLKLKGLMNTSTGKAMAEERHGFLELFLDRFYREWGKNNCN
jgi:uncharacterized protein